MEKLKIKVSFNGFANEFKLIDNTGKVIGELRQFPKELKRASIIKIEEELYRVDRIYEMMETDTTSVYYEISTYEFAPDFELEIKNK